MDTSVLLAVFFAEAQAAWAAEQLARNSRALRMSTVNLAETLIRLRDRQPLKYPELESIVLSSGIRFVPPDIVQARSVADARIRYPLNLGDCFVYALARAEECPILTLDADFRNVDVPVVMP